MKLRKLKTYVQDHGLRSSVVLTVDRIFHRKAPEVSYDRWLDRNRLSSRDYARMEKTQLPRSPLIGVAAFVNREDRMVFMQSLGMQVFRNFRALKKCPDAEYILVVEGTCTLRPDILWECASKLGEDGFEKAALIYFDSDVIGEDGHKGQPEFRPDYDPDLLDRVNYMGRVFLVRADLAYQISLPQNDEKAIHVFLKKVCSAATIASGGDAAKAVIHIPKVLYHEVVGDDQERELQHDQGRELQHDMTGGASAGNESDLKEAAGDDLQDEFEDDFQEAAGDDRDKAAGNDLKDYAVDERKNTSEDDLKDDEGSQASGSTKESSDEEDNMPAEFSSVEDQPLVSILIPNKDHITDLKRCVDSLLNNSTWENIEILIIENNSEEEDTFDYYQELEDQDERIHVVTWEGPFNYSAINNYGSRHAKGEYLLLLNNDTKILQKNSIAQLVKHASRSGVGAVGALLLYPDGRVQHAGIILGHGGIAGHAWEGETPDNLEGSFQSVIFTHTHNVSAVTGACMMMKRETYLEAGGMDESLEVTFNDVDLCLRLRQKGMRILLCPDACLVHYESASRGSEDSPEKVGRFHREIRIFVHRWEHELEAGDPFYNPNLTLIGKTWTCRDDTRETMKPYLKYLHMEEET